LEPGEIQGGVFEISLELLGCLSRWSGPKKFDSFPLFFQPNDEIPFPWENRLFLEIFPKDERGNECSSGNSWNFLSGWWGKYLMGKN